MLLARKNNSDWLNELVLDWLKLNIFDRAKYTTRIGCQLSQNVQAQNFKINYNTLLSHRMEQKCYWLTKHSSDWLKQLVFDWLELNIFDLTKLYNGDWL